MSPAPLRGDLAPIEKIRKELREQQRRRWLHPDEDRVLREVAAVYVWRDEHWQLAGFTRWALQRRRGVTRFFRKLRRKLHCYREESVRVMELWRAKRDGPPLENPRRFATMRPDRDHDVHAAPTSVSPRSRKRRYTRRVESERPMREDWVCFGSTGGRKSVTYFLGKLEGTTRRERHQEMIDRWPAYPVLRSINMRDLPKGLRRRIQRGAIVPSVTTFKELPCSR